MTPSDGTFAVHSEPLVSSPEPWRALKIKCCRQLVFVVLFCVVLRF